MVSNFTFPQTNYPQPGDSLLADGIRGNWDILVDHSVRHLAGEDDEIDASQLAGQGHGNNFNADMLDGTHKNELIDQIEAIVESKITQGTGQVVNETFQFNITQDAYSITKDGDIETQFNLDQTADDHTDPLDDSFDDDPTGSGTTFESKETWTARWKWNLPAFFINVDNYQVRKEFPNEPSDRQFDGLFFPTTESTDGNGDPIEKPTIVNVDLEDQVLIFEAKFPKEVGYIDSNNNFNLITSDFVDHPNLFQWSIEITGDVAVLKGHAEEHKSGGADPLDLSQLDGQGPGNGLNADKLDDLDAARLDRIVPTNPPEFHLDTYSQRASDFTVAIWYKPFINSIIVGLVDVNKSQIAGEVRMEMTANNNSVTHIEAVRAEALGFALQPDTNGQYNHNLSPQVVVDSPRTATLFKLQNTITSDDEVNIEFIVNTVNPLSGPVYLGNFQQIGTVDSATSSTNVSVPIYPRLSNVTGEL